MYTFDENFPRIGALTPKKNFDDQDELLQGVIITIAVNDKGLTCVGAFHDSAKPVEGTVIVFDPRPSDADLERGMSVVRYQLQMSGFRVG